MVLIKAPARRSARSFGQIQGAWEKTRAQRIAFNRLAFTFSGSSGDVGVPPLRTARVDAAISFTNKCEEVEGIFEVRSFGPEDDPVSDPAESLFPTPLPGGVSWLTSLTAMLSSTHATAASPRR
jgi:hypothetical protein